MYFKNAITTIAVAVSFLFSNVVFVGDGYCLAPDSARSLPMVYSVMGRGHLPVALNSSPVHGFHDKYGSGKISLEHVSKTGNWVLGKPDKTKEKTPFRQYVESKRKRINQLCKILPYPIPDGMTLAVECGGDVLSHREDNVLNIHGILLEEGVSDDTFLFVTAHEIRHAYMKGLPVWWEELLNVYCDVLYLAEMGDLRSAAVVNNLKTLEGADRGYGSLLEKRNLLFGDAEGKAEFLGLAVRYLYCRFRQDVFPGFHLTFEEVTEALDLQLNADRSYLGILRRAALRDHEKSHFFAEDIPADGFEIECMLYRAQHRPLLEPDPPEVLSARDYLFNMARLLQSDYKFLTDTYEVRYELMPRESDAPRELTGTAAKWRKFEDCFKRCIPKVLGGHWDDNYTSKAELIAAKKLNILRNLEYLPWKIREAIAERIDSALSFMDDYAHPALVPMEYVCAILFEGLPNLDDYSDYFPDELFVRKIKYILDHGNRLAEVPFRPPSDSDWGLQNYMGFLIQNSVGFRANENENPQPDSDMLVYVIHRKYMRLCNDYNSDSFARLLPSNKTELRREMVFACASLAEYVGFGQIAWKIRDRWARLEDPKAMEDTEVLLRQIGGLPADMTWESARLQIENAVKTCVRNALIKEFGPEKGERFFSGVIIKARVKATASALEKVRVKYSQGELTKDAFEQYVRDIFGVQIAMPGRNLDSRYTLCVWNAIREIFVNIYDEEHRRRTKHGYEDRKFNGLLDWEEAGVPVIPHFDPEVELQFLPTRDDLRIYRAGRKAHWLYKLQMLLKYEGWVQKLDTSSFTAVDLGVSPRDNFNEIWKYLNERWEYAGVVVPSRIPGSMPYYDFVRMPKEATVFDLFTHFHVNQLNPEDCSSVVIRYAQVQSGGMGFRGRYVAMGCLRECRHFEIPVYYLEKNASYRGSIGENDCTTARSRLFLAESKKQRYDRGKAENIGEALIHEAIFSSTPQAALSDRLRQGVIGFTQEQASMICDFAGLMNKGELYRLVALDEFRLGHPVAIAFFDVLKERLFGDFVTLEGRRLNVLEIGERLGVKPSGQRTTGLLDSVLSSAGKTFVSAAKGLGIDLKRFTSDSYRVPILLLAKFALVQEEGRQCLKTLGVDLANAEVRRRVEMLIAGQYGVYNIRSVNQLCAVVCVDEQFLCKVAVDCSEAAFPLCRISFKNGCSNEVISTYALGDIGAKAELALDVKRRDRFNNEVYVEIQAYPGDTTIGRFDRVIAELSEVEGVAEVEFPAYIPKSEVKEAEFIARLPLRQGVTADQIVAALGMMEKIGIKVMAKAEREGLKGKKRYGICYLYCRCPEALSAELREKIFGVFLGHLILRKTDPKDQFSLNAGVFPKSGVERVGFNCRVSLDFFYADGFKEEFFDEIKKHVSLGLSDIEIIAANAGTVGLYFTCNKPASMPNELLGILVDIAIGVTGQQRISEGVIRRSGSTLMTEVPWRKPVIPLLGRTSAVCV